MFASKAMIILIITGTFTCTDCHYLHWQQSSVSKRNTQVPCTNGIPPVHPVQQVQPAQQVITTYTLLYNYCDIVHN